MVEQWSSKPYAWVRFLLSLFITLISPITKLNNHKKILIKINKTNFSANLNKINYLKLCKKLNFSLYKLPIKLRKIIISFKTVNINSNLTYQPRFKKHNRLLLYKSN